MSGKVLLVHGGTETDETGLGLISTRVWVVNEADKEQVVISASFDKETHTYHLEVRSLFFCFVFLLFGRRRAALGGGGPSNGPEKNMREGQGGLGKKLIRHG